MTTHTKSLPDAGIENEDPVLDREAKKIDRIKKGTTTDPISANDAETGHASSKTTSPPTSAV